MYVQHLFSSRVCDRFVQVHIAFWMRITFQMSWVGGRTSELFETLGLKLKCITGWIWTIENKGNWHFKGKYCVLGTENFCIFKTMVCRSRMIGRLNWSWLVTLFWRSKVVTDRKSCFLQKPMNHLFTQTFKLSNDTTLIVWIIFCRIKGYCRSLLGRLNGSIRI